MQIAAQVQDFFRQKQGFRGNRIKHLPWHFEQ